MQAGGDVTDQGSVRVESEDSFGRVTDPFCDSARRIDAEAPLVQL